MNQRTGRARVGDVEIAYDIFDGGPRRMVLVMGIGAQRVFWDDALCARLADQRLRGGALRSPRRRRVDAPRSPAGAAAGPHDDPRHARAAGAGAVHAVGHGRRRDRAVSITSAGTGSTSSGRRWAG
jgi:hypothetical protein